MYRIMSGRRLRGGEGRCRDGAARELRSLVATPCHGFARRYGNPADPVRQYFIGERVADGPPLYGDFASPAGSSDSALSFAFAANAPGLPQNQGSDPAVAASINHIVSPGVHEIAEGRGGLGQTVRGAAPGGIHAICSADQTEIQLQTGGEFWATQAVSATPVRFPSGVFLGNSLVADPLTLV